MKNKKFRKIKQEIRILGIDDAPFTPWTKKKVMVIGTVFRGGNWLDGILRTYILVDGSDATDNITRMINNSRHKDQLRVIMLDGVTFAGFNVVNIKELFEATEIPVVVIIRKSPRFEKIKEALKRFDDWERRWSSVLEAGRVYKVENEEPIYIQAYGIDIEDAMEVVRISTTRSAIPEPIRVAHLIAAGVATGESKGNA